MDWRKFKFIQGKTRKFWWISREGNCHTVQYGKIGTNGQTRTKKFQDDHKAQLSYEKLVCQKTQKGYVEVGPIRDLVDGKFGSKGKVFCELFERDLDVHIKTGASVEYAQACADLLNSLSVKLINALCEASIRYCHVIQGDWGVPRSDFEPTRNVLQSITPAVLIVPDPGRKKKPVVQMELNCSWEEEHGMEWVIRDDKVQYVGSFNMCNPLGKFPKARSNYA